VFYYIIHGVIENQAMVSAKINKRQAVSGLQFSKKLSDIILIAKKALAKNAESNIKLCIVYAKQNLMVPEVMWQETIFE
jgi:hypothetical protein